MVQNKALIFVEPPTGWPEAGKHIKVEAGEFDLGTQPPAGGLTVKTNYVSFDPYQRGRMAGPSSKSYINGFELGKPVVNFAVVSVLKSDNDKFKPGDVLFAPMADTAEYSVVSKDAADTWNVIDNPFKLDPKIFLAALGMPGLTAYSSLYAIGKPKKGEVIFISAASGAVGQVVGQLAKREGLTVIGSVGDDKKLDFITKDLGFDGGFNYKKEKPIDALKRLAPEGLDIYYDNVGGEQLEASLDHMKFKGGRIVACGMISQYNSSGDARYPIRNLTNIVSKSIHMQGFIVLNDDMGPVYQKEHQENMQKWIHDGSFKSVTSVTHGIDNAAEGLIGLFEGKNFGKAILEVSPL